MHNTHVSYINKYLHNYVFIIINNVIQIYICVINGIYIFYLTNVFFYFFIDCSQKIKYLRLVYEFAHGMSLLRETDLRALNFVRNRDRQTRSLSILRLH